MTPPKIPVSDAPPADINIDRAEEAVLFRTAEGKTFVIVDGRRVLEIAYCDRVLARNCANDS